MLNVTLTIKFKLYNSAKNVCDLHCFNYLNFKVAY